MTDFRPIFVVGNSRSGTTLMASILKGNSEVHTFSELHYFERLWDVDSGTKFNLREAVDLAAKLLLTVREGWMSQTPWQSYVDESAAIIGNSRACFTGFDIFRLVLNQEGQHKGKTRVCEQTPRNVYYLSDVLKEYPGSQALIMVRDPRAILLSQKNKWKRKELRGRPIKTIERIRRWANYHAIVTSALWNAAVNAGLKAADHPRVRTVHFEELVTNPAQVVADVCEFLGLAYSPAMLDVSRSKSPTGGRFTEEGNAIDATVAERWRTELTAADIYWCEKANGKNMQKLGYRLTQARPMWAVLALSLVSFPFKFGIAAILNVRSLGNIMLAVRRRIVAK